MYGFMLVKLYCLLFILSIGGGGAYLSGDQQENVRKWNAVLGEVHIGPLERVLH